MDQSMNWNGVVGSGHPPEFSATVTQTLEVDSDIVAQSLIEARLSASSQPVPWEMGDQPRESWRL